MLRLGGCELISSLLGHAQKRGILLSCRCLTTANRYNAANSAVRPEISSLGHGYLHRIIVQHTAINALAPINYHRIEIQWRS